MTNINKDMKFILVYTHESIGAFEIPNSILILKSHLQKMGVMSSQILIYSFKELVEKGGTESLFLPRQKNIFLISIPFFDRQNVWRLIARIKQRPGSLVVVGGSLVTAYPEYFLKNKMIDMIVLGEGETFAPYLLKFLKQKYIAPIPGAYILKNKNYIFGGKRQPASSCEVFESQKAVIRERMMESGLEKQQKFLFLEFSRGCLFSCSFCYQQLYRKNLNLELKEWRRFIPPAAAARLIRTAISSGFKRIWIVDDSLTSLPRNWLEIFLMNIKKHFYQDYFSGSENGFVAFYCSPIDFQKNYVMDFIKEMSNFFNLGLEVGLEALDRETLSKFNKPHKNNCPEILNKALKTLGPFIESKRIIIYFSMIIIHPWTTFRKFGQIIKFCGKWVPDLVTPLNFSRVSTLHVNRKSKIAEVLKNENLILKVGRRFVKYKFAHAKKALFPKDENDTDINRFVSFLCKTTKIKIYPPYLKEYPGLWKISGGAEKIRKEADNQFLQFYNKVLDEAEKEWPRLPYKDYEKACRRRVGEMEKIMNNNLKLVQFLRDKNTNQIKIRS